MDKPAETPSPTCKNASRSRTWRSSRSPRSKAGDHLLQPQPIPPGRGLLYQIVIDAHKTSPQFGPAVIGTLWAQLADKQYEALLKTRQDIRPRLSRPPTASPRTTWPPPPSQEMGRNDQAITRLKALLAPLPHARSGRRYKNRLQAGPERVRKQPFRRHDPRPSAASPGLFRNRP